LVIHAWCNVIECAVAQSLLTNGVARDTERDAVIDIKEEEQTVETIETHAATFIFAGS
jgi:hypothetical protein